MMFPFKNVENLQKLNESVSLERQVKAVTLRDKLGEQNYHQNTEKIDKLLTDTIKDTSENLRQTIRKTYINNNKAIENLHEKILELMNDKGMIAPYLASSLVNLFKTENKSQFKLKKILIQLG